MYTRFIYCIRSLPVYRAPPVRLRIAGPAWVLASRLSERFYMNMERAVVRCVPSESKLTISFVLDGSQKHMLRDQAEQLGCVLARIANNAAKGHGKAGKIKRNKADQCPAPKPVVRLSYNGEFVAEDAVNADAWQDGAVLHVGDCKYSVERNPPTLTTAELPASLLAGFPVCPKLRIEFGDLDRCLFTWYKERVPDAEGDDCWVEAGDKRVFTPSNSDIGLRMKMRCTPGDGARLGSPVEVTTAAAVEAGPGACTFDNRHMYTNKITVEPVVRVVSYNILADVYAQTEFSRTVLYPYCAPYALGIDYRQNLIKKELAGYNADILCLQEVDKGVFSDSLSPALDAFDLDGVFKIKERQHEGLATFFRRSRFAVLGRHDIALCDALSSDPLHADLLERISATPALRDKVLERSTVLQVTVLQSSKDLSRKLCVANTHLYWHPKGGHVRLIQMLVALRHLQRVISEVHPGAALLFAGDFNSAPSSGVLQLVTQGDVAESHEDWASDGLEELCPMDASSPFRLVSACGEPAYTNYVGGFHGCLDYVLVEPRTLEVDQVIPMPCHQEVTTHQALPSVSHPSDHIALVCDLIWK
ncbi:2',5'-phosphodiesterase 12 [Paramormyrops kingsleyae]|uniref:2',5'-phosphodiesterase 12 n=1 Tax=Paramormyrops kingsleyae TaxID=1676925 RepID=A0A3B3QXB6_9TELE|nr:2',5'-phosphodiesterase 12 [Paramormyrops kingsleyae]